MKASEVKASEAKVVPGVRVLGVDPGLTRCGLGVVDGRPGKATMVALGVVRTPSHADPGERLLYLEEQLTSWLERFHPDRVAIERVFADVNVASVMTTAHASAIAILVAARAGLPVAFHTPTEVKAAVTGSGRAGKAQVTSMVQRILGLADPPRPADAADALALAVCHAWRGASTDRLLGLAAQQRALAHASSVESARSGAGP